MSAASRKTIVFVILTALVTSAQDCITFNDEGVVSVNVESFTDTFPISPGALRRCSPTRPTSEAGRGTRRASSCSHAGAPDP